MTALSRVTLTVSPDEPAWMLRETNLPTPDSKGVHRYQVVRVVRNDRLVESWADLGPASGYQANQFNLIGGWVDNRGRGHVYHSVAELKDMADELRNRKQLPDVFSHTE